MYFHLVKDVVDVRNYDKSSKYLGTYLLLNLTNFY